MEEWKKIKGYEGKYQVSNEGRIKSLGNNKTRKEKVLKPAKNKDGYLFVKLYKNCEYKKYFIHRLVATAFISNPNNLPQVNHKDEDKTNNNVNNLEWCNAKYNVNYGTRNERVAHKLSKLNINNPKRSKKVLCIETNIIYESVNEAARQTKIDCGGISRACNGKLKTAGGYYWKYV